MAKDFFIHQRFQEAFYNTDKRYVVAHGGRGSGKSIDAGAICVIHAIKNPNSRILCVRGTQNKISESSLQVLKDVIGMMGAEDYFDITENTLRCKNGSEFLFYGAKNYHSFKSLQRINLCWVDEATELSANSWEILTPTIREVDSRFIITFNPEMAEQWVYDKFITNDDENAATFNLNYYDNPYFPDVLRIEMEHDKKTNTAKYLHKWEGKLVQAVEGALWKSSMFHYLVDEDINNIVNNNYNIFERIIVALDPSGTSGSNSDACGIMVVGKYKDIERYCILEDATGVLSPGDWASKSVALYNKYDADKIIYETNYGGDMVKEVIKNINNKIPIEGVRATKGKIVRAEPVAVLYENSLVDHIVRFADLEYELTTFTGETGQKSPNRLDALVWGLSYLSKNKKTKMHTPMVQLSI